MLLQPQVFEQSLFLFLPGEAPVGQVPKALIGGKGGGGTINGDRDRKNQSRFPSLLSKEEEGMEP